MEPVVSAQLIEKKEVSDDFIRELLQLLSQSTLPIRVYEKKGVVSHVPMSIKELLTKIFTTDSHKLDDIYLGNFNPLNDESKPLSLNESFQALITETTMASGFSSKLKEPDPWSIWLGPGGHVEPLHYDQYNNIHFCLTGSKQWILFRPTIKNFRAIKPTWFLKRGTEQGNCFATRSADEAIAAGAEEIIITINEGQCLYIPAFWWHQVSGISSSSTTTTSKSEVDISEKEEEKTLVTQFRSNIVLSANQFDQRVGEVSNFISLWMKLRTKFD